MPDRRWKRLERETAARLGARRSPNTGRAAADIDAGPFAIEHKARKALPRWFLDAVAQAQRNAREGQTPVVVIAWAPGPGRRVQRYVVLVFEDWLALQRP